MSRDHRKLRAFRLADRLVTDIYSATSNFPKDEWYGLRAQLRRAVVSASNLVEGSARSSTREYLNFCNIACGSAFETRYLSTVAQRLGYVAESVLVTLTPDLDCLCASLVKLVAALELEAASEGRRSNARSQKPEAPEARSLEPEAC